MPAPYAGDVQFPVMLLFHGFGSNAQEVLDVSGMAALADAEQFVVVAPEGQGERRHFSLSGGGNGRQDDVVFVRDVLEHLRTTLCVDTRRVYAAGISNGAAFTSVLACRLSDRVAAFGMVASIVWATQCGNARPVPMIAFHGTTDPIVPYGGGRANCCGGPTVAPVEETVANWARHDGCDVASVDEQVASKVRVRRWLGCKDPARVVLYTIEGGGHTWPGTTVTRPGVGATTTEISASRIVWEFVRDHALA